MRADGRSQTVLDSSVNGLEQRQLERQKSEETRILEMIKTGDPDKAAENLKFLLEAGLIESQNRTAKIQRFLDSRTPGTGPNLPTLSSVRNGSPYDQAIRSSALPANSPLRKRSEAVGVISSISEDGAAFSCSGFLIGADLLVTAAHCIPDIKVARAAMLTLGSNHRYRILRLEVFDNEADFAVARVEGKPGNEFGVLKLSDKEPDIGDALAMIFFRDGGPEQLVDVPSEDCRVMAVQDQSLEYGCSTGSGSGGAPLLSPQGDRVYGLHHLRAQESGRGVAVKSTTILSRIKQLNPGLLGDLQK